MKVLKFGGTSVGTTASLNNVRAIVDSIGEPAVVVVSALGGLTDKLIATAKMAAAGDETFRAETDAIILRHNNIINDVIPGENRDEVSAAVGALLEELKRLYEGVWLVRNLSERTLDLIVSFGERMSSVIVSRMVRDAAHVDSLEVVKTEKWFSKNIADTALTDRLLKETLKPLLGLTADVPAVEDNRHSTADNRRSIVVMGGFISKDRESGEVTNLGRGGSDYTAALVAAALDADVLEIWTDVDGFMTADPRIVKTARVLDSLSFVESMELCTFGAKVVYPPTIYPVFHKGIPMRVLNTFNPAAPGTWITDSAPEKGNDTLIVKGVTLLKATTLISMRGTGTENICEINSRTFNTLARKGIAVRLVDQPDDGNVFAFVVDGKESDSAMRVLQEEFAPDLIEGSVTGLESRENVTTLAIVGENMKRRTGTALDVRSLLRKAGIEVYASSTGVSETTAAFVVDSAKADEALVIAHDYCFPKD